METSARPIVNVYVVLPPGSSAGEYGSPQRLQLSFSADAGAGGSGRESSAGGRGRSLLLTTGVAAVVSLVMMLGVLSVTRSGVGSAAAHQVAAAVPPRYVPSLATGQAGTPAGVVEEFSRDLAQAPRVTPPPSTGAPSGPSAFGFNQ